MHDLRDHQPLTHDRECRATDYSRNLTVLIGQSVEPRVSRGGRGSIERATISDADNVSSDVMAMRLYFRS